MIEFLKTVLGWLLHRGGSERDEHELVAETHAEKLLRERLGMITEHFSYSEATHSNTARAHGIDNVPSLDVMQNIIVAAHGMEEVRKLLGHPVNVSSWFRSEHVNKLVGGSKTSDHMQGYSVDFTCPKFGSAYDVAQAILLSSIKFDQLIYETNSKGSKWVHISFAPRGRNQALTYKSGTYSNGINK